MNDAMQPHEQDVNSNLDYCVDRLERSCNMWTFVAELHPEAFGFPAMRGRLWMLAIPRAVLA